SCSAACRLFFESNLVTLKEAPDRGAAASNLVLAHRQNHFVQCQVRLLLNQTQQKIRSDVETAARAMALEIKIFNARTSGEIDATCAAIARERPDAVFISSGPLFTSRRVQLAHLATHHRIPAIHGSRFYPEVGGLISYGASVPDAHRQAGVYVGRILKGTKPADLPVVQMSKFELVINHQTARLLGLTVPPSLLSTADEVIE